MAALKQHRAVEKKVFFYRISIDGQPVRTNAELDFSAMLRRINRLAYDTDGRYEDDEDDAIISAFVDGSDKMRFGRIRRSNLPPIANGPTVTEIPVAPNAGLFECCHVVYFGNGVLGAEFNNYAPRVASRLPYYLKTKSKFERRLEISAIVQGSPLDALNRLRSVRSVTVKVATAEARHLTQSGGGLLARITASAERDGVELLEVTLGTARGSHNAIGDDILVAIRNLLGMPNVREAVNKLSATGYVQGKSTIDAIDLLEDDLVISKQFLRESLKTKTLNSKDAYAKIAEAYNEVRIE